MTPRALIDRIRPRYREALARDLAELMGVDPPAGKQAAAAIAAIAHRQAGQAATFGAGALGQAALLLDQDLARTGTVDPTLLARLIAAMAAELARG